MVKKHLDDDYDGCGIESTALIRSAVSQRLLVIAALVGQEHRQSLVASDTKMPLSNTLPCCMKIVNAIVLATFCILLP